MCTLVFIPFTVMLILNILFGDTPTHPILRARAERQDIALLIGIGVQYAILMSAYFYSRHQQKKQSD